MLKALMIVCFVFIFVGVLFRNLWITAIAAGLFVLAGILGIVETIVKWSKNKKQKQQ